MKRLATLALAGVFLLGGCNEKAQPETFLAGDSFCVGLAQTTGLKSVARVGAPTREVVSQLKRIPEGATVIVCAGTNDAANRLTGFNLAVEQVLTEAKNRKQKLIWVGPINTTLWWERYSDRADTLLALQAKDYISLRAVGWRRGERASDQIHLTSQGLARVWAIIKEKQKWKS